MADDGWIKLSRRLQQHWIWEEKPFSRGQAWIDLLFLVNHRDGKMMLEGSAVKVKRGSCITSIRKLEERWGWSNSKITRFLNVLESDGMLRKNSDAQKTVLTIVNYDVYQANDDKKTSQKRCKSDTETMQKHTNKNLRTKEHIPPISPTGDCGCRFERFWDAYPRKAAKANALQRFAAIDPDEETLERMLAVIARQKRTPEWTRENGRYVPYPSKWLGEHRWEEAEQAAAPAVYPGYRRLTPDD